MKESQLKDDGALRSTDHVNADEWRLEIVRLKDSGICELGFEKIQFN